MTGIPIKSRDVPVSSIPGDRWRVSVYDSFIDEIKAAKQGKEYTFSEINHAHTFTHAIRRLAKNKKLPIKTRTFEKVKVYAWMERSACDGNLT